MPPYYPQNALVCFAWISEKTVFIPVYNINLLGFHNRDGMYILHCAIGYVS